MHDNGSEFLLRTTNVKEKFPNKHFSYSANLTWEELQSLNAGEWFLKVSAVLWCVSVHTLAHKGICNVIQHNTVTESIIGLSRQILSVQRPSSQRRRR